MVPKIALNNLKKVKMEKTCLKAWKKTEKSPKKRRAFRKKVNCKVRNLSKV